MHILIQILIILHFLGLTMGFATGIANGVMMGLIGKAAPQEKAVLSRFPAAMARVGQMGIGLLWLTGLTLVFVKWGGFKALPWTFHVKITAVVILTLAVLRAHALTRRITAGDPAAAASMRVMGRVAMLAALTALVFAVLTFD